MGAAFSRKALTRGSKFGPFQQGAREPEGRKEGDPIQPMMPGGSAEAMNNAPIKRGLTAISVVVWNWPEYWLIKIP